jgi:rSAM/selenodomain-associated transferase 1
MKADCVIMIFAKAPVSGYAKTRLSAAIGEAAAAKLAERMIDETLRQAIAADVGPVILCCTPDDTHPIFVKAKVSYNISLAQQGEGDLGVRMRNAMQSALCGHSRAILIGTDIPELNAVHIRQSAQDLGKHQATFTPAFDGGYVLIGLSVMLPDLFEGVDWSTSRVMEQSRNKLSRLGIQWIEYPMLHDIDEPEDLQYVPEGWLK